MASTLFRVLLEKKIDAAVERMAESIVEGHAEDYARYRESVGYIRGMTEVIKLCDEVESENQ